MRPVRTVLSLAGLVVICACGSTSTISNAASVSPTAAQATSPSPPVAAGKSVLVGQSSSPATVIVMRPDGSVIATLPGTGLADQHAVGAYLFTDAAGTGKASSVDAAGTVKAVAPAAATLLASYPYSPALIVDSSTAIIGCVTGPGGCSAQLVDLNTGAPRTLLTVPAVTGQAAMQYGASLSALEVSTDKQTVWLREVSPDGTAWRLTIVGINLQSGAVTTRDLPSALLNEPDLAISSDGKLVAGQEDAGTNGNNLAVAHLHLVSLETNVDSDVQGTAPYVRGWPPPASPTIVFAPDSRTVAWWGGFNNADTDSRINVAALGASGTPLIRLDDANLASEPMKAVYWLDPSTLVAQTQTGPFSIDATTGAMKPMPADLHTLVAILS